jgi:hypothetical protein
MASGRITCRLRVLKERHRLSLSQPLRIELQDQRVNRECSRPDHVDINPCIQWQSDRHEQLKTKTSATRNTVQADSPWRLKKGEMAKEAERLFDGTGWLPEPLRLADGVPSAALPATVVDILPAFLTESEDAQSQQAAE